jgi:hypothetical protein
MKAEKKTKKKIKKGVVKRVTLDGSLPLPVKAEAVIQDYLSHPDVDKKVISTRNGRNTCYLYKLVRMPAVKKRIEYLRQTTFKTEESKLIWTREQIINNVQKRLLTCKTDHVYLKGHEMLGKWLGLEKQTLVHEFENVQKIQITLDSKKDEERKIVIPKKTHDTENSEIITNV